MAVRNAFITFFATTLCVSAADIAFEWDASPDPSVTGYRLYAATNSQAGWTNFASFTSQGTNCTVTATNLTAGVPLRFTVTSFNSVLESDPSGPLDLTIPRPPMRLKVKAKMEQASTVTGPYKFLADLGTHEFDATDGGGFFRVRMEIQP